MNALAQNAGQMIGGRPSNSFSAHLALAADVSVSIHAASLTDLQAVVAKLQPVEAANEPVTQAPKAAAPTPAPTSAPAPVAGNAAPTPAAASAPAAASGSASAADDAGRPTYDDVKARVLAMAKISRATAVGCLKDFGVDNANKLKLEDYPAFLAKADALIAKGGANA